MTECIGVFVVRSVNSTETTAPKKNYRAWHKVAIGFTAVCDWSVDEQCLRDVFEEFGPLADVVVRDYDVMGSRVVSGRKMTEATGCADLYFDSVDQAIRAVEAVNQADEGAASSLSHHRWIRLSLLEQDDPGVLEEMSHMRHRPARASRQDAYRENARLIYQQYSRRLAGAGHSPMRVAMEPVDTYRAPVERFGDLDAVPSYDDLYRTHPMSRPSPRYGDVPRYGDAGRAVDRRPKMPPAAAAPYAPYPPMYDGAMDVGRRRDYDSRPAVGARRAPGQYVVEAPVDEEEDAPYDHRYGYGGRRPVDAAPPRRSPPTMYDDVFAPRPFPSASSSSSYGLGFGYPPMSGVSDDREEPVFQSSLSLDAEPWRPMHGRGLQAAVSGSKSVSPSGSCGEQRALSVEEVSNMLRETGLEEKERVMTKEASPTAGAVSMEAMAPPGLTLLPATMKATMEHAADATATDVSDEGGLIEEAASGHSAKTLSLIVQEE